MSELGHRGQVRRRKKDHPSLRDLEASSHQEGTITPSITQSVVVQAVVEFYNEAQLDVLQRLNALLSEDDAAGM
ncbi:hypothetical protein ACIHFB_26050 [Streptomyces sp. NPDC051963]|uniref:hypothetical protein n=1 Tax=Streptomyces sp. NPDC051963 TaxID=3365678 RepID=UPI0037D7351B